MRFTTLASGYRLTGVSAAGLVILLHDHLLTLSDEINLIWRAPRSFAKYAFLGNRYLVLGALVDVNIGVLYRSLSQGLRGTQLAAGFSGLTGLTFTDQVCLFKYS